MREPVLSFCLALGALAASIFPVGIYCFFLASINRRPRPLLMRGGLDAFGLLCAASGFLLATIPILANEFYRRVLAEADAAHVMSIWHNHWGFWIAYYLLVFAGGWLMIALRRGKTVIYNVDADQFTQALGRALAHLGFDAQRTRDRIVVTPASAEAGNASVAMTRSPVVRSPATGDKVQAELIVDDFPSMSNLTLHWRSGRASLRREIERALNQQLENAAPLENAAAGWFLSASGLIFGAFAAIVVALVFLVVVSMR